MSETTFAARHSMDSPEWYTPEPFVEAARVCMGRIDLDPASHAEANLIVRADRYFTQQDDGLASEWSGRIFLNPPGGLVNAFWEKLDLHWRLGEIVAAVWIGYSLEQLQTLQQSNARFHPLNFPTLITAKRIAFVENEAMQVIRKAKCEAKGKRFNTKSSPSHSNYVSYLGKDTTKFLDAFSKFGIIVGAE